MKKSENSIRNQVVYRLFYVLLLICIGIFAAGQFLGLTKVSFWQLLTAFAVAGICTAVWNLKGRGKLLCIVALSGVLLLCVMPVSEKPYEWNFIKNAYRQVRETVVTCYQNLSRKDREDFGLAVSGFSENARLGSGFIEDERELINIRGKDGLKTNVYLTGKIYDFFDGHGWTQLSEGERNERFLDTLETRYAISCYDEEATRDYLFQTKLTLQYQYFNTGYLFSPLKTCEIENSDYSCDGPNLVFGEQLGYGTEYTVSYYQINLDQPIFYEMLEQVGELEKKSWENFVRKHTADGTYLYTIEDLLEYQEDIYEVYCEKPELSSYTYTKTPGSLSESVQDASDFLDYFMLESRQGYCSYFATANAIITGTCSRGNSF